MRTTGGILMGVVAAALGGCLVPAVCVADLVSAGDVMFIGINYDGGDDFAIVLLADAAATDVVHFSDRAWNGSAFVSNEGAFSWTVGGTGLSAGTVVTFNSTNSTTTGPTVSTGTLSAGTIILSSQDTVLAFIGSDASTPSTFLAAISNSTAQYDPANPTDGTLDGTGLTQGANAILLPPDGTNIADGGQYTGARSGATSFSDYVALIGNVSTNWAVDPEDGTLFLPFNTTSFQVTSTAVPEAAGWPLLLLAAAALAALRPRKTA